MLPDAGRCRAGAIPLTPITINLPPITGYQRDAIFAPDRSVVIEATTKAGKTYGCILWLLSEALKGGSGHEFWWVAPVFEQTRIAYRRFKRLLRETDPAATIWQSNDTDPSITLSNGSVLRFKSADKPDSLYGEDVHAAVVDEASRCKEEAWHAVRSTLTATRGPIRIIGNVKGRKNWAFKLARQAEAGRDGWKYAKITAADAVKAGVIDAEEVAAAKRDLPEHVFRELYEAEPSEDGGNPFGLQHIARCVAPLADTQPACYGADLAKSVDWTVVLGLDAAGVACRFDRWQHVPWADTERRLLGVIGDLPALVDSTGVGDPIVEGMQRVAPNIQGFKFTSSSKQQLMEGLALAIQQGEVRFPDGVIRAELEAFEYEHTRTGVRYSAPEGMHDDCVCALALAVERRRTFRPAGMAVVIPGARPQPTPQPDPEKGERSVFDVKRRDPNWGFAAPRRR